MKKIDLISYIRPPKLCGLGYVLLAWAVRDYNLFCENKVKKKNLQIQIKSGSLMKW